LLSYEHRQPLRIAGRKSAKTLLSYEHGHPSKLYSPYEDLVKLRAQAPLGEDTREVLQRKRYKPPAGYTTYEGHKLG